MQYLVSQYLTFLVVIKLIPIRRVITCDADRLCAGNYLYFLQEIELDWVILDIIILDQGRVYMTELPNHFRSGELLKVGIFKQHQPV